MKKILLTVAMLLSAAGMQAAASSGPQKLGIFPGNFRAPIDSNVPPQMQRYPGTSGLNPDQVQVIIDRMKAEAAGAATNIKG